MIGAAAARHLAESGRSVALIGPGEPEPTEVSTWDGPFSSHGDHGRITRIGDADPMWAEAAARSIARYPDIEQRSGIRFHDPCGLLVVSPLLDRWLQAGPGAGASIERLDADEALARTGVTLTPGTQAAFEAAPAGHINPLKLVAAQTDLAGAAGAIVVDDAVSSIERTDGRFGLSGRWGTITAERVLLATGAFSHRLFARDPLEHDLGLIRWPRTVLMVEVGERPGPDPAPDMPSLIAAPAPDARLASIYWVPPVRYPDGRSYLKIGGAMAGGPTDAGSYPDDGDLTHWFVTGGDPVEVEALEACVAALLPDRKLGARFSKPCVTTHTPSGHPIIEWVEPGLAIAIGGNGSAAKSSDELGRRAASLVVDEPVGLPG
jgi:sarcosine oxidase